MQRDGSCALSTVCPSSCRGARVAEWQTQRTQNPPGATPCEFDSRLGHDQTMGNANDEGPSRGAALRVCITSPTGHSNAKIRFQSSFMLITVHPLACASAISESLKVPMWDFGP